MVLGLFYLDIMVSSIVSDIADLYRLCKEGKKEWRKGRMKGERGGEKRKDRRGEEYNHTYQCTSTH